MSNFILLAQSHSHSKSSDGHLDKGNKSSRSVDSMSAVQLVRGIWDTAVTLFLFTKSDFKTIVFPCVLMAAASAPIRTPSHFLHSFFWVWLHLLMFDVSNQTINPKEDQLNKKDRPLPAKRITLQNALILRWALVPICWLLSILYSGQVLYASVGICILTVLHNELRASRHWVGKNSLASIITTVFDAGAILVISDDRHNMGGAAELALVCSVGILTSTIYAQDFKDVEGDASVGRKTVPILYPKLAAPVLAMTLIGWSAFLINLWQVGTVTAAVFGSTALLTAFCFLYSSSIVGYQRSYLIYNIWMTFAHCLPLFRGVDLPSLHF